MKNKIIAIVVMLTLALSLCACGKSSDSDEVKVGDNQRLATVMVSSIKGNEMTYMKVEKTESGETGTSDNQITNVSGENESGNAQMGNPPEENESGNNKPGGSGRSMEVQTDENGETVARSGFGNKSGRMNMGESQTAFIPVGTKVHTTTDTVTTFSRIASGDSLKVLFETDSNGNEVIVEIWMQ